MFYVIKNENEIIASFSSIIDARIYIEFTYPNFTDIGNYTYVISTGDILEIYSK